jgi:TPR repeat protein
MLIFAVTLVCAASPELETGRQALIDGDHGLAFRMLEPLSQQGNADAQYLLGEMFRNGHLVPKDPVEAATLFHRAAKQGHAGAQFALSGLLSVGLGVDRNDKLAAQWNLKAANQGHVEAQLQMGYRCDLGDGVSANHVEAVRWYVRAAENGGVDSIVGLAYCSGSGVPEDLVSGYYWLSVYLESHPADEKIHELHASCGSDMTPDEFERAEAKFAQWREANPTH